MSSAVQVCTGKQGQHAGAHIRVLGCLAVLVLVYLDVVTNSVGRKNATHALREMRGHKRQASRASSSDTDIQHATTHTRVTGFPDTALCFLVPTHLAADELFVDDALEKGLAIVKHLLRLRADCLIVEDLGVGAVRVPAWRHMKGTSSVHVGADKVRHRRTRNSEKIIMKNQNKKTKKWGHP